MPFAPLGRRFVHAGDAYIPAHRDRAVKMSGPLGLVAGLFGSVVGVGGGVLIVPAITTAVPIPQRIVTGTSLIAVLSTAAVSTYNFSQGGCVDQTAAAILGASAMLSAPIGARLTARMDCNQLRRLLAYFLLCAAPLVPVKAAVFMAREGAGEPTPETNHDRDRAEDEDGTTTTTTASRRRGSKDATFDATSEAPKLAAIGVVAGLASGLLGIGGGTVVTPLLALVSPLPQASVLGTSLLAMLPRARWRSRSITGSATSIRGWASRSPREPPWGARWGQGWRWTRRGGARGGVLRGHALLKQKNVRHAETQTESGDEVRNAVAECEGRRRGRRRARAAGLVYASFPFHRWSIRTSGRGGPLVRYRVVTLRYRLVGVRASTLPRRSFSPSRSSSSSSAGARVRRVDSSSLAAIRIASRSTRSAVHIPRLASSTSPSDIAHPPWHQCGEMARLHDTRPTRLSAIAVIPHHGRNQSRRRSNGACDVSLSDPHSRLSPDASSSSSIEPGERAVAPFRRMRSNPQSTAQSHQ